MKLYEITVTIQAKAKDADDAYMKFQDILTKALYNQTEDWWIPNVDNVEEFEEQQ